MYRKFGEMRTCGFVRYASGQTNRQTDADTLITILRIPTGCEAIIGFQLIIFQKFSEKSER